jgi:hypothetical protein
MYKILFSYGFNKYMIILLLIEYGFYLSVYDGLKKTHSFSGKMTLSVFWKEDEQILKTLKRHFKTLKKH